MSKPPFTSIDAVCRICQIGAKIICMESLWEFKLFADAQYVFSVQVGFAV